MNTKVAAIAVAAIMALVGLFAVVSETTDAADGDWDQTITVTVGNELGGALIMDTNEYAYQDREYTMTWKIRATTSEYDLSTVDWSGETTIGTITNSDEDGRDPDLPDKDVGVKFALKDDSNNIGWYSLNIVGTTAGTWYVAVQGSISVDGVDLTPVVYSFVLTVEGLESFKVNAFENATIGKNYDGNVSAFLDDVQIDATKYDWYATGLPSGIIMNPDGSLSGKTADSATEYPITVYATNKESGIVYTATTKIVVEDGESADPTRPTISLKVGDSQNSEVIFSNSIEESSETKHIKAGTELSFTITDTGDVLKYTAIVVDDAKGVVQKVDTSEFTVTPSGSGGLDVVFKIFYKDGGFEQLTLNVDVIGDLTSVEANIVIESH